MEEPLVIVELPPLPDMNDEQIDDLKHLIRYAKRMNKVLLLVLICPLYIYNYNYNKSFFY
jgi:hypothetical protein